jgi:glycosyltransferase involved in cell wall biosynthesis
MLRGEGTVIILIDGRPSSLSGGNGKTLLDINSFQTSTLKLKYKFFRFLFTRSLLRATLVIVPSQGLYELCRDWGVPESRLILIRNSVSVEKYSSLIQNQIDFSILTICRLTSWKGVDELIRYCSVHNTKMAVAGDGPERLHLESMSKTLNSDVTFFGDISQEAIINLMKRSKIFVLNSYYEGLPHALVEARAANGAWSRFSRSSKTARRGRNIL